MRVRKLVTLPVRLPLKIIHKLTSNLGRSSSSPRIEGTPYRPAEATAGIASEKTRLRNDSPPPLEECPICHDPVGLPNPEGTVESWIPLHCGHEFGHVCIQTWLQDSLDRDDPHTPDPTCPICRAVAKHSSCGHPVCIAPTFEMQWIAWQQYHAAAMEAAFASNRPPVRQRNRLQRREGHPMRPSFTAPRRKADTVGRCSVCAEMSKKKEQEKRIMRMVETDEGRQEQPDSSEAPTISRKNTLLSLRRSIRRSNGGSSRSSEELEARGRSMACDAPAPRIPTPAPVGSLMVGTRRISSVF